jgi:site-specific DNA recombinase
MRRQSDTQTNGLRRVRCAIYTRKSTEEGLDREFNSLDAQREAAEAYIASQRHEGWVALPGQFDDGGFSGGTMDRPALQRLLADVEAGRVDCVVVYKVDRLSRSLLDFARIIETFDRKGVSFVSVTQQFNTTSSMGRLTLNILLSFAQFEREIIAERIRDKVSSARRKGKYMGGMPVLGYDVDRANRRLVVNPTEAELVQRVFRRFLQIGSTTELARELNAQGFTTKTWTTQKGRVRPGSPWSKDHIYHLLNNPLYLGEVSHKGSRYPGEQEAIVSRDLWDKAHAILGQNYRARTAKTRAETPALLRGLLRCAHCGCAMGPSFTRRRGRVYRYYLCVRASKHGREACPVRTLAAGEIERAVVDQLRRLFATPELVAATLRAAREQGDASLREASQQRADATAALAALKEEARQLTSRTYGDSALVAGRLAKLSEQVEEQERLLTQAEEEIAALSSRVTEREVIEALRSLDPLWEELFPAEQERIVQLLVSRVEVGPDGLDLELRAEGLESLAAELEREAGEEVAA